MVRVEKTPEYFTPETLESNLEIIDFMLEMQVEEINKGNIPDFRILAMVFRSFASAAAYCENKGISKPKILPFHSKQYIRILLDCHISGIETISAKGDLSNGEISMEYMLGKRTFTGKLSKRHIESLPYNWINAWLLAHYVEDTQALLYLSNLYEEFLKEYLDYLYDGNEEVALYVHFLENLSNPNYCEKLVSDIDKINQELSPEDFDRKKSILNEILPVMFCTLSIMYQNEEQFEHHMKSAIESNLEWLKLSQKLDKSISEFDVINFDLSSVYKMALQSGMNVEIHSDYLIL